MPPPQLGQSAAATLVDLLDALNATRERTLSLIETIDGHDLERVHFKLMSPLMWDLGHIASFEDLWLSHRNGGLGGTIGNLTPVAPRVLLREISSLLGDGDYLLLGTDLVKDATVIEAAYDDSLGVTAEFNRNVIRRINSELGGNFDVDAFDHVAFSDHDQQWVEMRRRTRRAMTVRVNAIALDVVFTEGEELRTEISAKFTIERLRADLSAAGLTLTRRFTDEQSCYAVSLAGRAQ